MMRARDGDDVAVARLLHPRDDIAQIQNDLALNLGVQDEIVRNLRTRDDIAQIQRDAMSSRAGNNAWRRAFATQPFNADDSDRNDIP